MPFENTGAPKASLRPHAVTLGELLDHRFPPREHLLHPVLRQGESAMIWAPPGVGKTMLTLSMALAVAGGGTVLGWRAPKPWRVLLVDGEMAAEDLQDRLRMLGGTVEGFDADIAGEGLKVLARQLQGRGTAFPDIASEAGQAEVLRHVYQHGADLVILDNFSTLAEVQDENEAGAMNPVLAFLLALKGERVACILVHHSGKTGATYRGSSKLATTFEVILGLKPPAETGAATGVAFTTDWTKFRGAPHPAIAPRDVVLSHTPDGAQWQVQEAERDEVRQVIAAIRSGDCVNQREVSAKLGWNEAKTSRRIGAATARGDLKAHDMKTAFGAAMQARREEQGVGELKDF